MRISIFDTFLLLFAQYDLFFYVCKKWPKYKKLIRLYNEGKKRIFAELNIIDLIRKFRHLKSLLKNHDMKKLEDEI